MKKRSYVRAVTLNFLTSFGGVTIISAVVFGFIFGLATSVVAILASSLIAGVAVSALEEFLKGKHSRDIIASSRKPIDFKLIKANDTIEIYCKKGLFWVFISSGFEDPYKAQEYIASMRQKGHRKQLEEIGRFKA